MIFYKTKDTISKIKEIIDKEEKGLYLRFGDGDVNLVNGVNKNKMKQILLDNNYILVRENVENVGNDPFEDWFMNPKYINY
jgi:CRISPR/Cas system-associated protein Cas5 (RAMP superfamily)